MSDGLPSGLFLPWSSHSLLRGVLSPADLVEMAAKGGFPAIALADHGALYGLPALVEAARARGIKALAALRLPCAGGPPPVLVALDRGGYGRICALASARFERLGPRSAPREGEEEGPAAFLERLARIGTAGIAFISSRPEILEGLRSLGASDLYWGLSRGQPFAARARRARERGIPTIALAETRMRDELDAYRYRLLRAIDLRMTLSAYGAGAPGEEVPEDSWLPCGAQDMRAMFSALPEALEAGRELAERAIAAADCLSPRPIIAPYEAGPQAPPDVPRGRPLSEAESAALLERLCREGLPRRYGSEGPGRPDLEARLARELAIIRDKGFSPYFLTVRDIVMECPRTCGRGSAASSLVSYLLGLTQVEPLSHDLFFERFLNEGRSDPPDIDIDFPWDERAAVFDRLFARFRGRAAMVADHCAFRRRGALREAGLAFGASEDELSAWAALADAGRWEEIPQGPRRSAELIRGLPRAIGTHPGGVVILPSAVTDFVHVQPNPDGRPVIAWEKDGAEAAGLVKIDLLGNRSLAVLRDCIELCAPVLGGDPRASWGDFSVTEDARTRRLIERGQTLGVFYVESPATRLLLKKMGRGDFDHLVVASSIIRPAANRWIAEYLRRLHGGSWDGLGAAAEETLRATLGIMVYQEDVSRVAMAAAGFDATEADRLRKALSKKDRALRLPAFRERFLSGVLERGATEAQAAELWDMVLSFDGYSFCKAHSASYALVSYKLAWYKARRPLEFLCCVVNNGGGFYRRQVYLNEARRLGFPLLPPRVEASSLRWTVEAREGGLPALRAGLSQIAGLSEALAGRIAAERRKRPFAGLADFNRRCRPAADEARALVLSGALDGIGGGRTRPQLMWAAHALQREGRAGFEAAEACLFPEAFPPGPGGDYSRSEKLLDEASSLGLILSGHPEALFRERARRTADALGWPEPVDSRALPTLSGRVVCLPGTAVTAKEVLCSDGRAMRFQSFEDEWGIFETVLFPQAYAEFLPILGGGMAFLVRGRVQSERGAITLQVSGIACLSRPVAGSLRSGGAEAGGWGGRRRRESVGGERERGA